MTTNNPVFKIPSKNPSKFPKVDLASVADKNTVTDDNLDQKNDTLHDLGLETGPEKINPLNKNSLKIQTGREGEENVNSRVDEKQQRIQKRQPQQGQRKGKIQRNGNRKMNWSARVQFQQQQQLSLSTRIDDNSTLYELVDDLCKITAANSKLKDEIWSQMQTLSDRTDYLQKEEQKRQKAIEYEELHPKDGFIIERKTFDNLVRKHKQTAMKDSDFKIQEQFMEDMKTMPSAFIYGDEYRELRQKGIIPIEKNSSSSGMTSSLLYKSLKSLVSTDKTGNSEGDIGDEDASNEDGQIKREIKYLKLVLNDRMKYNEALLSTISEYENQLLEIMECMAQKHVKLNKDEITAIREYSEQVSEMENQMYMEYRSYTDVENRSVKLYDGVDRIANYIADMNLNKC